MCAMVVADAVHGGWYMKQIRCCPDGVHLAEVLVLSAKVPWALQEVLQT